VASKPRPVPPTIAPNAITSISMISSDGSVGRPISRNMELPNLGTADQLKVREMLGLGPEWGWDSGVTYDPGFAKFKLNQKGLLADGNIEPLNANYQAFLSPNGDSHLQLNGMIDPLKLQYEAMLRQNGDLSLKGGMPAMKGLLSGTFDRTNDANNFRLQYERNF
jgi:hypothetical protein